ncbi:hypothetical protein KR074_004555 [Drosophila pseudoananassae]|nr:hypothetical protein KR074_004555 [Drosophila pseudoananassae]
MPFGLCNATSTMSRLMDKVIPANLRNEVFIYLDDLLVVSSDFERHLDVLSEISLHIRRAGLTINVGKSHFCMKSVRYLGTSPYYMVFGQHMITSGSTYALLRKLNLLDDRSLLLNRSDSFEIVRQQASRHMLKAYEQNAKRYNLRARQVMFKEGQEVYRRNFKQSCFQTGYNSKFGPAFVKARVRKRVGNLYYELEDLQGHSIGKYHAKDIRQ